MKRLHAFVSKWKWPGKHWRYIVRSVGPKYGTESEYQRFCYQNSSKIDFSVFFIMNFPAFILFCYPENIDWTIHENAVFHSFWFQVSATRKEECTFPQLTGGWKLAISFSSFRKAEKIFKCFDNKNIHFFFLDTGKTDFTTAAEQLPSTLLLSEWQKSGWNLSVTCLFSDTAKVNFT